MDEVVRVDGIDHNHDVDISCAKDGMDSEIGNK